MESHLQVMLSMLLLTSLLLPKHCYSKFPPFHLVMSLAFPICISIMVIVMQAVQNAKDQHKINAFHAKTFYLTTKLQNNAQLVLLGSITSTQFAIPVLSTAKLVPLIILLECLSAQNVSRSLVQMQRFLIVLLWLILTQALVLWDLMII